MDKFLFKVVNVLTSESGEENLDKLDLVPSSN